MRNSLLRAIAVGNLAKAREQLDGASLSLREIRDSSHRRWKNGFQLGEKWATGSRFALVPDLLLRWLLGYKSPDCERHYANYKRARN
jgi:hypothetical protein